MTTPSPLRPEFIENASPDAIAHQLELARTNRDQWQVRVEQLVRLLDTRLGQIEAGTWPGQPEEPTLARVRAWVTSDVVTARTEFGTGYREAQRDIRDLINGATPEEPTP